MAESPTFRKILSALRLKRSHTGGRILFTKSPLAPELNLLLRALTILGLFTAVLAVLWWDRAGLQDNVDGNVSFVDVVYFTMVTITTVGYGDIVPVSDRARLIDAIFVTPVRIFVWFVFLGTAYRFLVQKVVEDLRMMRLQKNLKDHILVLGFGGSGTTATSELIAQGIAPDTVVVVDQHEQRVRAAAALECVGLQGEATREELLQVAGAARARAAIVALGRDDTTVLAILTLRSINAGMRIIATVQEAENSKLVRQSGANAIVAPFQVGGFLLADAVTNITAVDILTDMLSCEGEVAVTEVVATTTEVGEFARTLADKLVIAIRRNGRILRFWEDPAMRIEPGDTLIAVTHNTHHR
ncbi:MAG: NAD-binding protein [Gammaproteobacteria bacterium]